MTGVYPPDAEIRSHAAISPDGQYRYVLHRRWGVGPIATFIMLNPSTADGRTDDPTIRRCVGYARRFGCAALTVLNLYAYRATNPRRLRTVADPIGPLNDDHLTRDARIAASAGLPLVAAWGAHADPARVAAVLALPGMGALQALGVTKQGAPRHPLYLPADAQLSPWPAIPAAAVQGVPA